MENINVEEQKQVAWDAENEEIKLLNAEGTAVYFKREFPDIKHAFLKELDCVVCADEGTAHKDVNGAAKFCIAGSGLLLSVHRENERVQMAAKMFIDLGIIDVVSHGDCDFAALAYKRDFPEVAPTPAQIDQYAKAWSQKVAEEIQRMGHEASHTHVEAGDMERPPEFHSARVVYYDGVGGFNPNKEIGLPMGFVIERKFENAAYSSEELKVAADIAFGHHGFGDKFSMDLPFVIVVMAKTEDELFSLKEETKQALADNPNFQQGKIKIDGFLVV